MQICHHLHGGMGMDVTYPMHRYYSSIKDLTRFLSGPARTASVWSGLELVERNVHRTDARAARAAGRAAGSISPI